MKPGMFLVKGVPCKNRLFSSGPSVRLVVPCACEAYNLLKQVHDGRKRKVREGLNGLIECQKMNRVEVCKVEPCLWLDVPLSLSFNLPSCRSTIITEANSPELRWSTSRVFTL